MNINGCHSSCQPFDGENFYLRFGRHVNAIVLGYNEDPFSGIVVI
jgi:hypothetical protein